jgi:hypothetical protein
MGLFIELLGIVPWDGVLVGWGGMGLGIVAL